MAPVGGKMVDNRETIAPRLPFGPELTVEGRFSLHSRLGLGELVRLVHDGTLSQVYQARNVAGDRTRAAYALKVLRAEWQREPVAVAMLRREAQVAHEVRHPHLLPLLAAQLDEPPNY